MSASFTRIRKDARFNTVVAANSTVADLDASELQRGVGDRSITAAPAAAITADPAPLSTASMFGGVTLCNAAGGAFDVTTSTGTQLGAAWLAATGRAPVAGDSFDFRLINTSTTGAGFIVTLVAGTDVTLVGSVKINNFDTALASNTSAWFRGRFDTATTVTIYRLV